MAHLMQKLRTPFTSGRPSVPSTRPARCAVRIVAAVPAEGSTVRVTKPVKMFHVPKRSEGMDLQGMTGTYSKNVSEYKGKVLSANFQYKVDFLIPNEDGAKPTKFSAHLADDEFEVVP